MSDDTTGHRHAPSPHDRVLARDVAATVIPAGEPAVLPAGTKVTITHRLGEIGRASCRERVCQYV